jgi:PAP2 superfamily
VTDTIARHRDLPGARALRSKHAIYWWAEVLAVAIFYVIYSSIRNSTNASPTTAFENAKRLIDWQETLLINHEQLLQEWALHFEPLIILCNYFYGSLHFVVTIGAAVFLFRKFPDDYPRFRNTLGVGTALALIGFATFPLMPPRLLDCHVSNIEPRQCFVDDVEPTVTPYGFVDTLARDPAIWSFNSGAMAKLSNQFAAMPSVHCAWALWCAAALVPRLRRRWAKGLAASYPVLTVTVIVLTANHYFLDAVGGFFVLGVGYVVAHRFTRAGRSVVA